MTLYFVFDLSSGYGHMTPDTWVGQLLTVFYGLAGLPITMLALKTLGEVMVSGVQSFVLLIEKRLFKVRTKGSMSAYPVSAQFFLDTRLRQPRGRKG